MNGTDHIASSAPLSIWQRRQTLWVTFGCLLALQVILFWPTYVSLVQTWWRSETFAHGFVIMPISLYLIWKKRAQLSACHFNTDARALVPLLILTFGWVLGYLADVLVVQQFCVIAMIPALLWLALGTAVCRTLAFPLAFLVFSVPMGESLVYPLMNFTAAFTVNMVRLVGIPVFWEGMYFTLPSGSWSVVEACSGFRYVMASLTLGSLYAYLTYRSTKRRALFILASLIVPIFANGVRAFMIVMVGHLSSMKLATGVDHLIYGWVWFGVVMFAMFWIGGKWREDLGEQIEEVKAPVAKDRLNPLVPLMAVVAMGLTLLWTNIEQTEARQLGLASYLPASGWQPEQEFTEWQPAFSGYTEELRQVYRQGDDRVGLIILHYGKQQQGAELISSQNFVVAKKQQLWQRLDNQTYSVSNDSLEVLESRVRSPDQNLLVWSWYEVAGRYTSSPYRVKALETWNQLLGNAREGSAIFLYVSYDQQRESARDKLQSFLNTNLESLTALLERADNQRPPE